MTRWILAALLAACCVLLPIATPSTAVASPATVTILADDGAVEGVDPKGIKADRMTLRERKALGLTVGNIRRIMLQLREEGKVTADTPSATVSVMVADRLLEENAPVYSQLDPQFDWDKFMEFIEKIVELIMRIIGLFS